MDWEKLKPRIDNFLVYVLYPAMLCFDALPIVSVYVRICTMLIMLINIFYYKWTIYKGIYDEFNRAVDEIVYSFNRWAGIMRGIDRMLYAKTRRERFSGLSMPYENSRLLYSAADVYLNTIRSRGSDDFSVWKNLTGQNLYKNFGNLYFYTGSVQGGYTTRREGDIDEFSVLMKV